MPRFFWIALPASLACVAVFAADWPTEGGSPQREGWAKNEKVLTKENVSKIQLLYQSKFNAPKNRAGLSSPVILGNIIGWKGFKELLFVGGGNDMVYSIDADLNKPYFTTHLGAETTKLPSHSSETCPGGMTASVAIPGSSTASIFGFGPPPPPPPPAAAQAAPGVQSPAAPGGAGAAPGIGEAGPPKPTAPRRRRPFLPPGPGDIYAVASDGFLYNLRQQDGNATARTPIQFLPPNSKVSALNVSKNFIYAATSDECGGSPNAIYGLALEANGPGTEINDALPESGGRAVKSFLTNGSGPSGVEGTAIAPDGTVFAEIADGQNETAGKWNDTVIALSPDLQLKDYFTPPAAPPPLKKGLGAPGATPLIFQWQRKSIVLAGGRDGRLYLLDAASPGGPDHHQPLFMSEPVGAPETKYAGNGIWGAFSTWDDTATNTRWVYASLWGPPNTGVTLPATNGNAAIGSILAFKVEDRNGQPALTPQWISRNMTSPAPPITANGLVFALSTGQSPRIAKENGKPYSAKDREKMATHATLYVLDAANGKELFSTGDAAQSPSRGGFAVANGRVYFTTEDNSVFCYGFPLILN